MQMNKRCITSAGSRDWTREEMMAYLDWDKSEEKRMDTLVAQEMGDNPFASRRRGMGELWRRVERDVEEQERLYSAR